MKTGRLDEIVTRFVEKAGKLDDIVKRFDGKDR